MFMPRDSDYDYLNCKCPSCYVMTDDDFEWQRFMEEDSCGVDEKVICAVVNDNLKMVKMLLKNGFNVDEKDEDGWTPLHFACNNGNYDISQYLLKKEADVNAVTDDGEESTPLLLATMTLNLELVKLLVYYGADIETEDAHGWFPLAHACYNGDLNIIQFLIDSGANINHINDGNENLLHLIINELINPDILYKTLKFILPKGIDVNLLSDDSYGTPIFRACEMYCRNIDSIKIVKLLLEYHADLTVPINNDITTCLEFATKRNATHVVDFINNFLSNNQESH